MSDSSRLHTSLQSSRWGQSYRAAALVVLSALVLFAAGCAKKVAPPPPPPPPPPTVTPTPTAAAPVINSFSAEPSTIEAGQSSTLRWSITGATDMTIDHGVGAVQSTGMRQVFPRTSTSYLLTVRGPGGMDSRSVTVTVSNAPPPPPAAPNAPRLSSADLLQQQAQDAFYDYDMSEIRTDGRDALTHDAALLKQIFQTDPNFSVIVEGHCDERGSAEYNLALGDRRATAAKDFLVQLGVPADRLKTISYGKERPQCTEENEQCWQKNRRAHLSPGQ